MFKTYLIKASNQRYQNLNIRNVKGVCKRGQYSWTSNSFDRAKKNDKIVKKGV